MKSKRSFPYFCHLTIFFVCFRLKDHQAPLVRDVKLQHALLGALRNLAVAAEGRHTLLENDILPPCLDLISGLSLTPITHPVVMKLLATLRLLVESETSVSVQLGEERPDVLAQIITYGNHEGIVKKKCLCYRWY